MKGQWWGGISEEHFNVGPYDTRDEIIAEMRAEYSLDGERGFWIGQQGSYEPFTRDWIEECFELEAGDVCDECGPGASDDWPPRIDKKAREEANAKITAILKELAGDCTVFPIADSEYISPLAKELS